ncbi:MAG TPA: hypothetical protein VMZ90_05740 [Vicinamibacterales bacterium]|nr:hypothetical protein [Vicinamibacterales bacterium]
MGRPSSAAAWREARLPTGGKGRLVALLSAPLSACVRLIPHASRVRGVLRLSVPIAFAARTLGHGALTSGLSVRERAIGRLLSMLHYRRVAYSADISVVNGAASTGPLLLLVRHSLLNQLLISRLVHDGQQVTAVMSQVDGHASTFGVDAPLDVLDTSAMLMRSVAKRLEARRIVIIAIDGTAPSHGYTKIDTPTGPWFVTDQPIRLALKRGIPIAVAVHDIKRDHVVTEIRRLAGDDADAIISGFCDAYGCSRT